MSAQRTASLRHDDECQAVLINLLLRNYLHYNLYDQADKLVSKTNFPTSVGNAQLARYHYYLGRIKAVQLNYTAAHTNLQQAIRRAPPAKTAPGFFQAVHKFFIVVELLMGDIPDRSLFRHPVLESALAGYFQIVKGEMNATFQMQITKFRSTLHDSRPNGVPRAIPKHLIGMPISIRGGQDLHPHSAPPPERDQDRGAQAFIVVFAHLASGYLREA